MTDKTQINADMPFEQALAELETIVRKMEAGQTSLEESVSGYERGMALKQHCEKKLNEAKAKIEKIVQNPDGSLSTAPFETE